VKETIARVSIVHRHVARRRARGGHDAHLLEELASAIIVIARTVQKLEDRMGQMDDRLTKLDAATTAVGTSLQKLRDQLAGGEPVTAEQLAHLDGTIAALTAMASNPTDVVPVAPPVL
jgi:ABC-type transporter Mla subunit MlaD